MGGRMRVCLVFHSWVNLRYKTRQLGKTRVGEGKDLKGVHKGSNEESRSKEVKTGPRGVWLAIKETV